MKYVLQPISLKDAKAFVDAHHRHNSAPQGHKFSIALSDGFQTIGVIIVGRPIARGNQDGCTLEVTRCCVLKGYANACSKLYAAAWRASKAMGYTRLISYTLNSEAGSSLKAVGFKVIGETRERLKGWDTPARPRQLAERYPTQKKKVWELRGCEPGMVSGSQNDPYRGYIK